MHRPGAWTELYRNQLDDRFHSSCRQILRRLHVQLHGNTTQQFLSYLARHILETFGPANLVTGAKHLQTKHKVYNNRKLHTNERANETEAWGHILETSGKPYKDFLFLEHHRKYLAKH